MNPAFIPIIFLWIVIFIMLRNHRKTAMAIKLIKKRKLGGNSDMKDLAKRFIDKECIINAFDGNQYTGVIKEITDGAILIDKDGKVEALNLEFVLRIREYPRKKNGKKQSVVLD